MKIFTGESMNQFQSYVLHKQMLGCRFNSVDFNSAGILDHILLCGFVEFRLSVRARIDFYRLSVDLLG